MKKFLILVNQDNTIYSFRQEVVQAIINQGHKVVLGLPNGERIPFFTNMECAFIPIPIDRRGVNPIEDFKLLIRYIKIIKREKPDIVLTYTIKPNVYGGIASMLTKTKYISTITGLGTAVENPSLLSKLTVFLYRIALLKSNKVFFQNETNKDFLKKHKVVKDNILVTPGSGVNLLQHTFEKYPEENEVLRFLFIGRIMKDKGIEEYLECAKYIKSKYPNTQFEILGSYDDVKYETIINTLQENNIVIHHGYQSDVDSFIKKSHVVVLPSYHEGLANVLLEAQACGRPVLATTVAGCKETFDEGKTGFGCSSRDAKGLIAITEKFIGLPYAEKEKMGQLGRKKVENEFDRNIVVNMYMNETNKILEVKK